ncbi:MAG TPA: SPFH domain-containing protein, partial [Novosphingobium sp.]|nr:SPFH domain-containing protein [Novosphingobium sp.]
QAEAAMHAAVGQMPLAEVMAGTGRARLEETVRARLQQELDAAHAGVAVEGVEIRKADPPARVSEAFRKVAAARQEAGADIARAQAFSQQLVARAEGEAGAFDRIYAQYRLAPEVTCRRMYYETMERVLAGSNKIIAPRGTSITLPLADPARQPAANGDQAGNPPPAARPAPQTAGTPTTGTQP